MADDNSGETVGIKSDNLTNQKIQKYLDSLSVRIFKPQLRKINLTEIKQYTKIVSEKHQIYYRITFNKLSCMLTYEETTEIQNKIKKHFENIDKIKLQERLNKITN